MKMITLYWFLNDMKTGDAVDNGVGDYSEVIAVRDAIAKATERAGGKVIYKDRKRSMMLLDGYGRILGRYYIGKVEVPEASVK